MNMGFGIVVAIRFSSGKIYGQCSTKRDSSHAVAAKAMNVIDLEILIPASPEFIWRFLGDPAALPQWQEDVTSVSFLSTQREGQGTRWRASSEKANDVVVEVSAWYDTLGYEYRLLDGTSFQENQGRIRLHEVTDGTLVRWTFQYELSGVLGGLRNAMRLKRGTTNLLQTSLRNLHQLILQESGGISTHEAKASVREAPAVDERLSYQPRHPSAFHEPAQEDDGDSATDKQPVLYDEFDEVPAPDVADTDTKPNPVVLSTGHEEAPPLAEVAPDDTKPIRVSPSVVQAPATPEPRLPEPRLPQPSIEAESRRDPPVALPEPVAAPPAPSPRNETRDTAHLSVFEIFGLRRPSEMNPLSPPLDPARDAEPESGRQRLYARRDEAESAPRLKSRDSATETSAPVQSVTGWRRRARRRKTVIRSHN